MRTLTSRWDALCYDYDAAEAERREMTAEGKELYEAMAAAAAEKRYELPEPPRGFTMPPD
jgi:hypothetical protein